MEPMQQPVVLTRQQLYEKVWAEPVSKVAVALGVSDVAVAKTCRKHDIPIPPRGYWAKKRAGQSVRRMRLPEPDREEEIRFHANADRPNQASPETPGEELPPVEVAENLKGCHPLVRQAKEELASAAAAPSGKLQCVAKPALRLQVSRDQLDRALRIADALLKSFEKAGGQISPGPIVRVHDIDLRFEIEEAEKNLREEVEAEDDFTRGYQFFFNRFATRTICTGRLQLLLNHVPGVFIGASRNRWSDTERRPLEKNLAGFVAAALDLASRANAERAEQHRRAQKLEEERKQREQQERDRAAQAVRVETLKRQATAWHESQTLRRFIEAVRQKHEANGPIEPGSELAAWIEWATAQADRLDPLCQKGS